MARHSIRPMVADDRPAIEALLDDAVGRGYWDPHHDLDDIVVVAADGGHLVGVATGDVSSDASGPDGTPTGAVRLVAVDERARRGGIATRLVAEVTTLCMERGAAEIIAYAWVHGPDGIAPLSEALRRSGYVFERRIEGFYGSAPASETCPACLQSPCVCPADLYWCSAAGGVVIRPAMPADTDTIVEVWLAASRESHDFVAYDVWLSHADAMRDVYLPESDTFVAADSTGGVIGFASLAGSELAALFVEPSRQGDGVGSSLVRRVQASRETLTLGAYTRNARALAFYRRHGFLPLEERIDERTGERETRMRWDRAVRARTEGRP